MKKGILLLCFLMFVLFGCRRTEIQPQEVSVELGSELSLEIADYISVVDGNREKVFERAELDLSDVNIKKIGTYEALVIYGKEIITVPVNVVDTTAPVITIKETEFLEGTKVVAENLVEVSDSSETKLFLYSNDSKTPKRALNSVFLFPGNTFRIRAVDKYGNETIEVIAPLVVSKNQVTDKINVENYLHKIWVLDQLSDYGQVSQFTFVVESVNGDEIQGRIMIYNPYKMRLGESWRNTALDGDTRGWKFTGTISENYAQCRFVNWDGQEGTLHIWFLEGEKVEAAAVYDDASLNVDIISRDLFSPYNISDLDDIYHINNSFKVNIDFYGNVYIMCGKIQSQPGGKFYPVAYIADKDGNIFYEFDANFLMEIKDAYTGDFNGDGKTDVKIVVDYSDEKLGVMENYFIQTEVGFFDWYRKYEKEELSLDKKLRESP